MELQLRVSKAATDKLDYLLNYDRNEIGAFGISESDDDLLYITDWRVPKQKVTIAYQKV